MPVADSGSPRLVKDRVAAERAEGYGQHVKRGVVYALMFIVLLVICARLLRE